MRKIYPWEQRNRPFVPPVWNAALNKSLQSGLRASAEGVAWLEMYRIERLKSRTCGFFEGSTNDKL